VKNVAHITDNKYKTRVGKPHINRPCGRTRRRWENGDWTYIGEKICNLVRVIVIKLGQNTIQWEDFVIVVTELFSTFKILPWLSLGYNKANRNDLY